MILIADCGSTKIDWCILKGDKLVKQFFTTGVNALLMPEDKIRATFETELKPQVEGSEIFEVYYYGAGCLSEEICSNVSRSIASVIPSATTISVNSDLLAAARALCGRNPGIACILGTGSNSCYYDGEKICDNVSPLGYILGDEGSGAVLGKLLVGDVLKKQLPAELCEKFLKQFNLDRMKIIENVYKKPAPNRFLALSFRLVVRFVSVPSLPISPVTISPSLSKKPFFLVLEPGVVPATKPSAVSKVESESFDISISLPLVPISCKTPLSARRAFTFGISASFISFTSSFAFLTASPFLRSI